MSPLTHWRIRCPGQTAFYLYKDRPPATKTLPQAPGAGKPQHDRRRLELARIVVARLDEDRTLLDMPRRFLERSKRERGTLSRGHREWAFILDSWTWTQIREMLLEDSDEGQRLRQSSPFVGIVTEAERLDILARFPLPRYTGPPIRMPPSPVKQR